MQCGDVGAESREQTLLLPLLALLLPLQKKTHFLPLLLVELILDPGAMGNLEAGMQAPSMGLVHPTTAETAVAGFDDG